MKAVSWIALGLSMAGALVAAGAYWRVRSTGPGGELESLKARVAQLEAQLGRPAHDSVQLQPKANGGDPASLSGLPASELADLRKRIENLERRPPSMGARSADGSPAGRPKAAPEFIEAQRKRLMDSNQPARSRLSALAMLRQQASHKTDDVVDAALTLLATIPETNLKAAVIRNLQGAENARVIPPLIQALKGDPSEEIRDESAKTLGDYVGQAEVKSALEAASTGDASERVRNRAKTALNPK